MSRNGTSEQLLTTAQAAARLGIHRNTVLQRVAYGHLTPAFRMGGATGAYLFHEVDVDRMAAREERKAPAVSR